VRLSMRQPDKGLYPYQPDVSLLEKKLVW